MLEAGRDDMRQTPAIGEVGGSHERTNSLGGCHFSADYERQISVPFDVRIELSQVLVRQAHARGLAVYVLDELGHAAGLMLHPDIGLRAGDHEGSSIGVLEAQHVVCGHCLHCIEEHDATSREIDGIYVIRLQLSLAERRADQVLEARSRWRQIMCHCALMTNHSRIDCCKFWLVVFDDLPIDFFAILLHCYEREALAFGVT
mmetsp:Transcript_73308/g.130037  ORF Transcript_73308/g.130037 Transcript_73308/m.130037 type:complete len:202 (-) Transcript_73308:1665-2270(-)